jgi:hypothetical protein
MDVIKKQVAFEVKQIGDSKDRVLRFVGSDETPDRDSDIIEVNGWKTNEYMKNPVFLWAHNSYSLPPIGKAINVEKDMANKRLVFDIKFPTIEELSSDIENPAEHAKFIDMVYNMYKKGYLNATSVGFRGIKFKTRDDEEVLEKPEWQRGRRYIEQNLMELSAVPVPANPNALQSAKSKGLISDDEINSFFIEIENEQEEKTGARLSKETKEALKAIKVELQEKINVHNQSHATAMKAYKDCMKKLDSFTGDTEVDEENEEPKSLSIEEMIEKTLDKYTERLEALRQRRDPDNIENPVNEKSNETEIDLESIEYQNTKKDAADDELDIEKNDIKQIIRDAIKEEIKYQTGKI